MTKPNILITGEAFLQPAGIGTTGSVGGTGTQGTPGNPVHDKHNCTWSCNPPPGEGNPGVHGDTGGPGHTGSTGNAAPAGVLNFNQITGDILISVGGGDGQKGGKGGTGGNGGPGGPPGSCPQHCPPNVQGSQGPGGKGGPGGEGGDGGAGATVTLYYKSTTGSLTKDPFQGNPGDPGDPGDPGTGDGNLGPGASGPKNTTKGTASNIIISKL